MLLANIAERIPTEAVIFDVSSDRGIRSGNQSLTEIAYRMFLQQLGYARDLDLAELEIILEGEGRLEAFEQKYRDMFNKDWDTQKGKVAFALSQASRVTNELDPKAFPAVDSWMTAAKNRADITPSLLAERYKLLVERRLPGKSLVFVIDEVGQFVSRDVQKMLDLQAVVQCLGRVGRGRTWIIVTSQEKLTERVGGLDDRRVELARLMDRFPSDRQVHLEPSDISEVTSKRVLSKNAGAERSLRELFDRDRGRLTDNTRLTADIQLPELTTDSFTQLYPLLPYHVDLIIQVVSGLRTQASASRHVGGANRTIIKIAQQLLVHPRVNLADQEVCQLARIDHIYDLVSGNIASEIRGKIDSIPEKVPHSLAQPVAKAICLLQFVKSIHRTPENIAATLHPATDADTRISEVRQAIEALEKAGQIRKGDDGYRIPTPAEDDWERQRSAVKPKPADVNAIHAALVKELWQPQPSHKFLGTKNFKAGLTFNHRLELDGDIPFHVSFAEPGKEFADLDEEFRTRSQTETKSVFWAARLDETMDQKTVEVFRSREILKARERNAQTKVEGVLVAEERRHMRGHELELKSLLKRALLAGAITFQGNDRSRSETETEIGPSVESVVKDALPKVFDRFQEAAAQVTKQDLESVLAAENLRGLTAVYAELKLIQSQGGNVIFRTDTDPLREVLAKIVNRTSCGESATGRYLADEFAKDPFGWDFDVTRIFVACLLRAGKIEATSQGETIDSALTVQARTTLTNNNLFRQASFQPKVGIEFEQIVEAAQAFKAVFGKEVPELEQGAVAGAIRSALGEREPDVQTAHTTLVTHGLPGVELLRESLDQMRAVRNGTEEQTINIFRSCYRKLKDGIKRAQELKQELTEPRLQDIKRARQAMHSLWPFLAAEPDAPEAVSGSAKQLEDLLARETFYTEFPAIDQHARLIEDEHQARYDAAAADRQKVYHGALKQIRSTPGWDQLKPAVQEQISEPLANRCKKDSQDSIPLIRSDIDACPGRLQKAIEEVMRATDGNRLVTVSPAKYFAGGIETEEQLDAALTGLREECVQFIGQGKKLLLQ